MNLSSARNLTESAFCFSNRIRAAQMCALVAILAASWTSSVSAQTWNPTAAGGYSWGTAGNWTGGIPGSGDTANMNIDILGDQSISLSGGTFKLENLNLGDSGGTIFNFSIGTGTLEVSDGGAGTITNSAGSNTIGTAVVLKSDTTVSTSSGSTLAISGGISGNKKLFKTGAGTLELSGANTYGKDTAVNGGKLIVSGSISSSSADFDVNSGIAEINGSIDVKKVTVNSGGTLQGNLGSILVEHEVKMESGSTLAPGGSSIGTLTVDGELKLKGTYSWGAVMGGSAAADLTVVKDVLSGHDHAGSLDLTGSTLSVSLSGSFTAGQKFTLMAYKGRTDSNFVDGLKGIFAGYLDDTEYTIGGYQWLINYDDTTAGLNGSGSAVAGSKFITLTAVPELGSMAMVGVVGFCSVLAGTNRRRRQIG